MRILINTGVQNFAVFAFLGPYQDPSTASLAQLPQVQISGGNLFYSFTEPAGVSGITYGAQWSATLQPNDWHAIADTGDTSTTPPGHLFSVPMHQRTTLHAVDGDRSIARVVAPRVSDAFQPITACGPGCGGQGLLCSRTFGNDLPAVNRLSFCLALLAWKFKVAAW